MDEKLLRVTGVPDEMLTENAVDDVQFRRPGLLHRGYDEEDVDDFLDHVQNDLRARRHSCTQAGPRGLVIELTADDVRGVAFRPPRFARRGYDDEDVDDFLDKVARTFSVLDAELDRRGWRITKR